MELIIQFIELSQVALSELSDFGSQMVGFLSREYTLLGTSFSVLQLVFGAGLFVFLGAKFYSLITDIVIPN